MTTSAEEFLPSIFAEEELTERPPRVWRTIIASAEGRVGLMLLGSLLFLIVLGPLVAPYSPTQTGVGLPLAGPSGSYLLGTDELGRDILSRFLNGGHVVLLVPLVAVSLAFVVGGILGMLGAFLEGFVDGTITRLFDLILTLPPLLIVLVAITSFGTSRLVLIAFVALVYVPRVGRVVRGAAQMVISQDFVSAAITRRERTIPILMREVLPNIAAPLLAELSLRITYAILFVAALDFLGLGAQPPSSEWGLMVSESRNLIVINPWAMLVPAFAIAALGIAFSFIGDAIIRHVSRDSGVAVL